MTYICRVQSLRVSVLACYRHFPEGLPERGTCRGSFTAVERRTRRSLRMRRVSRGSRVHGWRARGRALRRHRGSMARVSTCLWRLSFALDANTPRQERSWDFRASLQCLSVVYGREQKRALQRLHLSAFEFGWSMDRKPCMCRLRLPGCGLRASLGLSAPTDEWISSAWSGNLGPLAQSLASRDRSRLMAQPTTLALSGEEAQTRPIIGAAFAESSGT